jgi:hypothetical protein
MVGSATPPLSSGCVAVSVSVWSPIRSQRVRDPFHSSLSSREISTKGLPCAIPLGHGAEHARGAQACSTARPAAAWIGAVLWAVPQRDAEARMPVHRQVCGGLAPSATGGILLPTRLSRPSSRPVGSACSRTTGTPRGPCRGGVSRHPWPGRGYPRRAPHPCSRQPWWGARWPVAASPSRVRATAWHLLMGMSGRPSPRSPQTGGTYARHCLAS